MTREALTELLAKVEAGRNIEDMSEVPSALGTWGQSGMFIGAYRGSLDAAKALHEAVLPGWDYGISSGIRIGEPRIPVVVLAPRRLTMTDESITVEEEPAARAWLIAILKALIAESQE